MQRRLATLLGAQVLGDSQLLLAPAQRHERQRLIALHPGTEQAAHRQRARAVDGQGGACLRAAEQAHQRAELGELADHLRQRLAGQDLALQQGADGHFPGIDTGQAGDVAGDRLLHADGQVRAAALAHRQLAALRQWLVAAGLDVGLLAVVLGQCEQHLEVLANLTQRQHFGLGGFSGGQQGLLRLQQTQQFAGHRRTQLGGGRNLCAKVVNFACHQLATC
ncbi:hypothetical protein D3C79_654690 [compost metagenome]